MEAGLPGHRRLPATSRGQGHCSRQSPGPPDLFPTSLAQCPNFTTVMWYWGEMVNVVFVRALRSTRVPLRVSGVSKETLFYNWAVALDFF